MEETSLSVNELIIEPNCFSDSMKCAEDNKNYKVPSETNENLNDFSKKPKNNFSDDRHFKKSFKTKWNPEEACNIPEWHPPQHKFAPNSMNEVFLNGNNNYCAVKQPSSSASLSVSPQPFIPRNMNVPRHHSHQVFHPPTNPCPSHSPMFLESPETLEEASGKPHHFVVNVFVNPHASFTVSVGDQVQVIQGPATVRMVSPSPPLPSSIPEQPGQLVHQIVDDNGVLSQVIISSQNNHPIMSSSPQPPYAPPPFMVMHPPSYHQHHQRHHHPPPMNNNNSGTNVDQRTAKRKERLQMKLSQRKSLNENAHEDDPIDDEGFSVSRTSTKFNHSRNGGSVAQKPGKTQPEKNETSKDMEQIELALSKIDDPKVLIVETRSAVVRLNWCESPDLDIDPLKVKYRLLINKSRDDGPSFTEIYSGDAQEIALNDLTPVTTYFVKYQCWLDDVCGRLSPTISFTTDPCEPDQPSWPKLVNKTKSAMQLKWNATIDNGSKVTHYILEYDEGRGGSKFVEIYNGPQKQYKATKLQPSTGYRFRLAALNSHGKSPYSESICYSTNGPVPSQTDPPMMSDPTSNSLTVSWIKRPSDDSFILQMEDESTGHGFLTVYNGPDLSHKITNLRRFTDYKFRLQAKNEEGSSKWSDVITFKTFPERPSPPTKLQVKGKISSNDFKFTWDGPKDNGGISLDRYIVYLDAGKGFQKYMETTDMELLMDELLPGQTYKVKVQNLNKGGTSEFSDVLTVTTQAVPPSQCYAPRLIKGKTKPTHFCIAWDPPENDGGSPVIEYSVLMTKDNTSREAFRGGDLTCTVAGLLAGETYCVQVKAINKAGSGPWSEVLEAMTASSVPDRPPNPEVVARSPHSVLVLWHEPKNNGSDVVEYRLESKQVLQDRENGEEDEIMHVDEEEAVVDDDYTPIYCGCSLNYEVNKLLPATKYLFRVQAVNSCGLSPHSRHTTYVTQPGSPSSVPSLHVTMTTATSVRLSWKPPRDNGSPITSYHFDLGNGRIVSADGELTEFKVDGLVPDTSYKVRIQPVNGVGVGPYSAAIKFLTRSLPPEPPRLEVVSSGPKFIKFKWGDNKGTEVFQYCLELSRDGENYHTIYQGTGKTHKVAKLNESSEYYFRIFATNEAGDGPFSNPIRVSTSKSPPPSMRAPNLTEIDPTSCLVHWQPIKMLGCNDELVYILQVLNTKISDSFQEVYRGEECQYQLTHLIPNSEYQVRVSAVRVCPDDEDIVGPFSPPVVFNSGVVQQPETRIQAKQSASANVPTVSMATTFLKLGRKFTTRMLAGEGMTERHWAVLLMLAFAVTAAVLALLAKSVVD